MKQIFYLLIIIFLFGCKSIDRKQTTILELTPSLNLQLKFLDEYVFTANKQFKNTIIGGLSGIDYVNGYYYIVSDDSKKPRIYKANIQINESTISDIKFRDVIQLDSKQSFYRDNAIDLESIILSDHKIILSSEGRINRGKNPTIFTIDTLGNFEREFKLPKKFLANSKEAPRHNGVFEGLSKSYDGKGLWSAIEFPLKADGKKPKYPTTNSPIRITYFNIKTLKPEKEFIYELSPLPRKNKGGLNLNGLTDILEYKKNHFLIIERTYQSGYKNDENIVRVYEAKINENATNSLHISSLKNNKYIPIQKRLVFDFNTIKSKLTNTTIDNIEGITFGPKLLNGHKTLLLISDDNFQKYGKQLNQFILLEIINE